MNNTNKTRRRKIGQVDIATNQVIAEYNSLMEAGAKIGKSYKGISHCLHGRQATCGGYRWIKLPAQQ